MEGPVPGISKYDHAEEALDLYLRYAQSHASTVKRLWYILNIRTAIDYHELSNKDAIISFCDTIINKTDWEARIIDTIDRQDDDCFFFASNTASRLGININDRLLPIVKNNPVKYWSYAMRFFMDPSMIDEMISLYESILPLDEMATGMGNDTFAVKLHNEQACLEEIINILKDYPMKGLRFIITGLNSRVVRARNTVCGSVSNWLTIENKTLVELSPELFAEIKRIHDIEVNADTKKEFLSLISEDSI